MGKIIVSEFVTLDGVMQAPGGGEIDRSAWNLPFMNDEAGEYKDQEVRAAHAMLLGGNTYKAFASVWPTITGDGFADRINAMPKYVVSPDLTDAELVWENTTQIKENAVEELRKLKQELSGDLLVYGSATLVKSLAKEGLVDEYKIQLHPVILGKGTCLFQQELPETQLELTENKALDNGLLLLTYKVKK